MYSYRPRSASEYFGIVSSRKYLMVLAAGSMLAACFFVIHHIPNMYESSASIVVTGGKDQDREMISGRMADATERLSGREFLEPIIVEHHLYGVADADGPIDGAVAAMRRDIKVDPKYRGDYPEAVQVSYRNPNPETAKEVATELISVFVGMNDALEKEIKSEQGQITQEMADIEIRMHQLGIAKAGEESRRAAASRAQGEANMARAQKAAASASAEELSNKQYALEKQIEEEKRQIAAQEKIAQSTPATKDSSYGALLVHRSEIEGQLQDYSAQYTPENPKVIQAKAQLAAVNDEIAKADAKGAADAGSPASNELRSMQRELGKMQIDLEVTNRELGHRQQAVGGAPQSGTAGASVPAVAFVGAGPIAGGTEGSARPDDESLKTRYTALLTRQDALEREELAAAGLGPGIFQVVDAPGLPRLPSGPNMVRLVLLAAGLAFAFAIAVVAAIEIPKLRNISTVSDVEYYLGTPVIALIPENLMPVERSRARKLRALRVTGSLLLAAALVPLLVIIFDASQIFQLVANH
jgi:polysaccharide biosynthesis transport protein